MPFFDRHWGLRAWGATLAALAAFIFPVRYLQVAAIWDARRGWDLTPDVIFAVASALAFALAAVLLARSVAPSRKRREFRQAVLDGRETVRKGKPEHTPPGDPPLIVVQRIRAFDRGFGCFAALLTIVDVPISILLALWTIEVLLGASAAQLGITGGRAFMFFIVDLVMPFALWGFGTWARDVVARSPKYTADAEGLTWRSRWGRARTVRWDDARLLELTTYRRPEPYGSSVERRFLLYGHDTVIRIDETSGFYRDSLRLVDLIERRTGLDAINLSKPAGIKFARVLARRSGRRDDLE